MPKRTDLASILIIGSGPIVIGQACEFDYSGTQACKALREEGYRVVLVNSNPATIMTDPEFADRTYIEPITADAVEAIIARERPDAVLPTMGGQTALNTALELAERGVFERYDCELIGANVEAIRTAEDRESFRQAMDEIGLASAHSRLCRSVHDAEALAKEVGYPLILRPSRTLGGSGGGIVYSPQELSVKVGRAISASPNGEVLIEQSLLGWKEIELEVMRDLKDNVVIICAIENLDPMGVHTGDSITVAPLQTVTDKEYQLLRDAAVRVMRRIGVETGGSNVQFALDPKTGRMVIIEMNPRVSRSSALASKATGFPIAKIAAKLAVGYSLDELPNDITKKTPACFEPSIDYVVVKIPRFNFEKFPGADQTLGTQMKSVGEVLSFGRTFRQALQKALYSMEIDSAGFDRGSASHNLSRRELIEAASIAAPYRLWLVAECFRAGASVDEVAESTKIDPWFLRHIAAIVSIEEQCAAQKYLTRELVKELKEEGFSDRRIARLTGREEDEVRSLRAGEGIVPAFFSVDTCAAEFEAYTPYFYSSYEGGRIKRRGSDASVKRGEVLPSKGSVVILGSGPNRIGQGIEFDYCCVHAAHALREDGFDAVMVNCNPETVSTDYDTSTRLYFEPLTLESVLGIIERERPRGVIIQFGGQTPLKLAGELARLGVPLLGTSVDSIDIAEDRERFSALCRSLELNQPAFMTARSLDEALESATKLGYPLMIRPSFVLGGRAMRVLYSHDDVRQYVNEGFHVSHARPVLLDRYLHQAVEVDVDVVSDGKDALICGVMEHIERAGIHSGDSYCAIPPPSLPPAIVGELCRQAMRLTSALSVVGLMNVQFAISKEGEVFILEANPRASRTIPFVSKATGVPWAKIAARVMVGASLASVTGSAAQDWRERTRHHVAVKGVVFPFNKFHGVDTILGPEMKSTGEVMGIGGTFAAAFGKALSGAGVSLPRSGKVFVSVMDADKPDLVPVAQQLIRMGFSLLATEGTARYLAERGVSVERVNKVSQGSPHVVDALGTGDIVMVINTPEGTGPLLDSRSIRLVANELKLPLFTTIAAAEAVAKTLHEILAKGATSVCSLQEYHDEVIAEINEVGVSAAGK